MISCSGSEGKNKVYVNCKENYKDINDYNRLKKSKSENKVAYLDFLQPLLSFFGRMLHSDQCCGAGPFIFGSRIFFQRLRLQLL